MSISRRDVVEMLREENAQLKARGEKLSARLTRYQQAFRALERMDETMRAMGTLLDLRKLIGDLLTLTLHACDSENGSLLLLDDETNELVFTEVIGDTREQLLDHRIDAGTGIVGHVIQTQQAMLVSDVHKSSQWSSEVDEAIGFNTNALMCAPLFNSEKTYGAIEVINNKSSAEFDENDLAILRVSARFISEALAEAEDITLQEGEQL